MLSVIMLNVTYKPSLLKVDMLSVIRLNVIMLSVVAPSVVTRLSTLKRMVKNQKSCKKNFENVETK
jgi:hypothetical protein